MKLGLDRKSQEAVAGGAEHPLVAFHVELERALRLALAGLIVVHDLGAEHTGGGRRLHVPVGVGEFPGRLVSGASLEEHAPHMRRAADVVDEAALEARLRSGARKLATEDPLVVELVVGVKGLCLHVILLDVSVQLQRGGVNLVAGLEGSTLRAVRSLEKQLVVLEIVIEILHC